MLTREQFDNLEKYTQHLYYARDSKCCILGPRDMQKILEIVYGQEWRIKTPSSVLSCGTCKIKELSKIANMYDDFKYTNNQ